jgi:3-oxoacyl-[acyl-carrier protein] reductase
MTMSGGGDSMKLQGKVALITGGGTVSRTRIRRIERIGLPEEIASVALFFASAESAYVIGQVLSPNGGIYT